MFFVEITKINHLTGEVRTWRDRKKYKTLGGAERAAIARNSITKPDGKTTIAETMGRVIPV